MIAEGKIVAQMLSGSWRRSPDLPIGALTLSPGVLDTVIQGGASGLVWRRIRHTCEKPPAWARPLRDAYHLQRFHAVQRDEQLFQAVELLRSSGIEPLVIKGWSIAHLYPEYGLRPYGDIDLCVAPHQFEAAHGVLSARSDCTNSVATNGSSFTKVDLHQGVPDLPDRSWQTLYEKSRLIRGASSNIRTLSAEDHFRLLCLHFMRHGACRPIWLCDVAVALEQTTRTFDWNYCLSGSRRLTEWVLAVTELAHLLLDAHVAYPLPWRQDSATSTTWLADAVLMQWGSGKGTDSHNSDGTPFASSLPNPGLWMRAIRSRWPNPIEAAIKMRRSPKRRPSPAVYELAYLCRRAIRWTTVGSSTKNVSRAGATQPVVSSHTISEI